MPVDIQDPSLLSLDIDEVTREVVVPVDGYDRNRKTVRVTLRKLPFAIKEAVALRQLHAVTRLKQVVDTLKALSQGESLESGRFQEAGEALLFLRRTQEELIRWGVVSHNPEDFTVAGAPFAFESEAITLAGESVTVAGPRMVQFYRRASPPSIATSDSCLLALLARAVLAFQDGKVETPEEIWSSFKESFTQAPAPEKKSPDSPEPSVLPSTSDSDNASS